MPQPMYFRLANPDVHSISVDGITHHVNADGLLEVHTVTPNLHREITEHYGAEGQGFSDEAQQERLRQSMEADEAERQLLFAKLDDITGKRTDRRRSVQQLREAWEAHSSRQVPDGKAT